jgi:hypothetical protein
MSGKLALNEWLPAHQQHLLYTLAHADDVIDKVCTIIFDYVKANPLGLESRLNGAREEVVISSLAPIPQSVPRHAADAINQLRSALEHALSAEVEHLMGRTLEPLEAQSIEMPVPKNEAGLATWFSNGRRKTLPVLQADGVLGKRIAELQPFGSGKDSIHPLRLLAEHSNLAKHRKPAEYALRLGRIVPDFLVPGLNMARKYPDDRPFQAGDVLASVPAGQYVPMDIWPMVGIRRPHTGEWAVLTHELRDLESWVRVTALPKLIAGTTDVEPIPPHLDISKGYEDYPAALANAEPTPAAERLGLRLAGGNLRIELPGIFKQASPDMPLGLVDEFVQSLSDAEAVEVLNRYMRIRHGRGEPNAVAYLRRILRTDRKSGV